jgi:hypothetical protein
MTKAQAHAEDLLTTKKSFAAQSQNGRSTQKFLEVAMARGEVPRYGSVGKLVSSLKLMHQTHLVRHPF